MVQYGRWALRGAEAQTLGLLFKVLPSKKWADLLKAFSERATTKGERDLAKKLIDAGAHGEHHDSKARSSVLTVLYGQLALRGAEVQTVDLIFEALTSEQWAELLKAPLEQAAAVGERYLTRKLLQAGANIGDALHEATRGGYGEIVKCLLANGASVLAKNTDGDTPFHLAATNGQEEMVQLLLLKGTGIDALDSQACTPLGLAVFNGHEATTLVLAAAGADVSLPYGPGKMPLPQVAASRGHDEVLRVLVEHGADVNAMDGFHRTALHYAAYSNNVNAIHLLLVKGADQDVSDSAGWTSLALAVCHGHVAATLILLAAGADVSHSFSEDDMFLSHFAAEVGDVEILTALIEHGADVGAIDGQHWTALHHAANGNKVDAIHALVEAGANLEARDQFGSTPLHGACDLLNHGAVASLIKHGVNVNAQNSFLETPLMLAAVKSGGTQEPRDAAGVVDSLLRAGADETIVNDDDRTAAWMMEAGVEVQSEDFDRVVELLANAPADKAWRRRGYLALCRARLDRVQPSQVIGTDHAGTTRTMLGGAGLASEDASGGYCETVEGGKVDETDSGDWAVVLAKVLGLQEEGLFRAIVGYL